MTGEAQKFGLQLSLYFSSTSCSLTIKVQGVVSQLRKSHSEYTGGRMCGRHVGWGPGEAILSRFKDFGRRWVHNVVGDLCLEGEVVQSSGRQ